LRLNLAIDINRGARLAIEMDDHWEAHEHQGRSPGPFTKGTVMHIVIFLFDGITAFDAIGPYESLSRLADVTVQFVAKAIGPVRTGDGFLALHADADIASVRHADILIVPGGHRRGLAATIPDPDVQEWVRAIDADSRWTTSVCTGSLILAASGVPSGRSASTHWRAKGALARHGVEYSTNRVTIDGKYLTSAGVSAGLDMGLHLCGAIAGREVAEAIQLSMQYDPQPPFDTGNPETAATAERIALIKNVLRQ
jgi:transcriptional regulator GlxA family with amidase domain